MKELRTHWIFSYFVVSARVWPLIKTICLDLLIDLKRDQNYHHNMILIFLKQILMAIGHNEFKSSGFPAAAPVPFEKSVPGNGGPMPAIPANPHL
jgi:hypothetical protein